MDTLLIVDDDEGIRTSLAQALSEEYIVHTAASGTEAVRKLRENRVDVMLLDLVMDDGDGFSVLGYLSRCVPKPATIVFTVREEIKSVIASMKLGADDYLVKHCDIETVRRAVRKALGTHASKVAATAVGA